MQELYITIREKDFAKKHCHFRPFKSQEIYRPGTTISHASNLCTAVGRGSPKQRIQGQRITFEETERKGWNKNILL